MPNGRDENEEAPLLSGLGTEVPTVARTVGLPRSQIAILLLFLLADHAPNEVLDPFLPALVKSLDITGGDEGKVSVYVGLVQSFFFSCQTLTALFWSRASDILGRKPILLSGMLAAVISMLGIGLTQGYWWLVASRCIYGAFNGNMGVIKSFMGEAAPNSDNLAQLYFVLPLAWSATGTVGPLVGGLLSSPAERYPGLFGSYPFLIKYPYFLPCVLTAIFMGVAWIVAALFLKETHKHPLSLANWLGFGRHHNSNGSQRQSNHYIHPPEAHSQSNHTSNDSERPLPMSELFRNPRVLFVAFNYACLSLTQASLNHFQPVQLSTSIENGGMGFDPPLIGRILSIYGFSNGAIQVLGFAPIHRGLGSKRFFICGLACAIPMTLSFPVANFLARTIGIGPSVWFVIGIQVLCKIGVAISYGALFIIIVAAAPNHTSLGAINGFCLTTGNLVRTIGPILTNTLFSFSMKNGLTGGYIVYAYLLLVTIVGLAAAFALPNTL